MKNFLTVTLLSLGVPMILMGDEVRRTQGGNNNAYCQDNEISWFDWTLLDEARRRASLRQPADRPAAAARRGARAAAGEPEHAAPARRTRPGTASSSNQPDWGDSSHSLALTAELRKEELLFHLILNAYWEPLDFELPAPATAGPWRRWIDTALDSPHDIVPWQDGAGGPRRHLSGRRPLGRDAVRGRAAWSGAVRT